MTEFEARAFGPLPAGHFRVLVLESDLRTTRFDTDSFETARAYAVDAASEADDTPPLSFVFNDQFEMVYRGRHYAAD